MDVQLAGPLSRNYATAKAAASEVSSILESRISGTSLGGDVQETGRVLSAFVATFGRVT